MPPTPHRPEVVPAAKQAYGPYICTARTATSPSRPYPRRTTPQQAAPRRQHQPRRAEQRHSSFCAPRRAPARRVTVTPTALPPTPSTSVSALLPGHRPTMPRDEGETARATRRRRQRPRRGALARRRQGRRGGGDGEGGCENGMNAMAKGPPSPSSPSPSPPPPSRLCRRPPRHRCLGHLHRRRAAAATTVVSYAAAVTAALPPSHRSGR